MKMNTTLLEEKARELPKFNRELDDNIAKLAEMQRQSLAEIQQVRREQAALTATIEACTVRIAERDASPPTIEQMLAALKGPIEARMQDSMASILVENRTEIERLLSEHNEALYNGVWGKLSLTSQMTETIYAWLRGYSNGTDTSKRKSQS